MNPNLQRLLTDFGRQSQQAPTGGFGQRMASYVSDLTQGMLTSAGRAAAGSGIKALENIDLRPAKVKLQERLGSLDPMNRKEDRKEYLKIVNTIAGPEKALQLQEQFRLQDETRAVAGSQTAQNRTKFAEFVTNKYGEEYGKLAAQGIITPSNIRNFIPGLGGGDGYTKGASSLGRDTEQNIYQITTAFNKDTGELETKYAPYSPGAPATPKGKVTPIATETGMTLSEELALQAGAKGREKEITDFAGMKSAAVEEITDTNEALYIGQNALQLLEEIETGGLTTELTKRITDVFGITPTSVTSFQNQVGQLMLKKLKLFGANPTEGERAALAELGAELKKGKGANRAIIERFVREQLRRKERLQFLTRKDTDSLQEYLDFVNSQYASDIEPDTDTDVLDFNNLPD